METFSKSPPDMPVLSFSTTPSTDARSEINTPDSIPISSLAIGETSTSKRKVKIIAISGPTCSGKSTLACVLPAIFGRSAEDEKESELESAITFNKDGEVQVHPVESESEISTSVLHQDDYFFADKGFIPLTTFPGMKNDYPFLMKSLNSDECSYVSTTGSHAWASAFEDGASNQARPTLIDRHFPSYSSDGGRVKEGGGRIPIEVHAPDSDCDAAIRFTALLQDIDIIQAGGTPLHPRVMGSREKRNGHFESKDQAASTADILFKHADIITELRDKVQNLFQQKNPDASFLFVEGFILYCDPATKTESDNKYTSNKLEWMAEERMDKLLAISAQLAYDPEGINSKLEDERDEVERQLYECSYRAKRLMQEKFDVKLFLPITEEAAKERRGARMMYVDFPEGHRVPGQMFKTEGYFTEVAWKNHVKSHEWLSKEGAEAAGIFIRPLENPGVTFAIRWAVDTILAELGYIVPEAQAMTCCGEGCCDRRRS